MHVIYTPHADLHATDQVTVEGQPPDGYEVPARAEILLRAVQTAQFGAVTEPVDHGLAPILAIHDSDYVHYLRTVNAESTAYFGEPGPVFAWTFAGRHAIRKPKGFMGLKGYYAFGHSTPILAGTWEAVYWSAQCALTAADLIRDGQQTSPAVTYALCRPPGHHAGADLYGGYCYLNNAAIAARHLQAAASADNSLRPRIAILDVDYHHGNGTQLIFYSDPSVLYCSLHAHPDEEYPYYWGGADELGEGPGIGTNRNWPLPRGTGEQAYLLALEEALAVIREFAPAYLVVSVGFDTVEGDPEGGFCLTTGSFAAIGQRIAALGLPTVLIQEGGYLLDALGESALAFLQPFADLER